MGYRIGSFNMYKYQAYRSDDEIKKNIDTIANIIVSEAFDIVALQEIFSKVAMQNLLYRLGPNWAGRWDSPQAATAQAAEGYAFLWNTKRIELASSQIVSGKRIYEPRIYNQYRIDRGANQRELIRNPYFARFHPIHTFFEIRLINIHILYSGSKSETDEISSLSDVAMRKKEFEILAQNIYGKESDKRYGNNMPAYTILLGDYNLNLNRTWTKGPYVYEIIEISDERAIKRIRTIQDQLTTLKNKSKSNPNEPIREYANNYDHFSYDENRFQGVSMNSERVDSVNHYLQGDFDRHKREVSDHVPIALNFNIVNER